MGNIISKYKPNSFNEYKFKNKIFYLPANCLSIKINDFGDVLSKPNMISTNILFKSIIINQDRINCQKCDVFNFFHDLYDGQELGSKSINSMMIKKSKENKSLIRNVFKKYIDVDLIDKINKDGNKNKLNWTWYINDISFLKKIVKTPKQYLNSTIFDKFTKKQKNAIITNKYGI